MGRRGARAASVLASVLAAAVMAVVAVAVAPAEAGTDAAMRAVVRAAAVPAFTAFAPNFGPAGTKVTISGSGFSGVTAVLFNGAPAAAFHRQRPRRVQERRSLPPDGGRLHSVLRFRHRLPLTGSRWRRTTGSPR